MLNFLLGVLSSIAGSLILIVLTRISSKYIFFEFCSRMLGNELLVKFENRESSKKSLQSALNSSSMVYIFAGRGNELRREPFEELFHKRPANRKVDLQILLPNPEQDDIRNNWLKEREAELSSFDSSYKVNTLKTEIIASIQYLKGYFEQDKCILGLYSFPHIGRFIVTDDYLFLTPYSNKNHARDCPVYKFKKGHLYYNYLRLFCQIKLVSKSPT